jgi:hypothetical protein
MGTAFSQYPMVFSPSVPRQETGRPFVDRIQLLDFTSTKKSDGSIYWVNVAWRILAAYGDIWRHGGSVCF